MSPNEADTEIKPWKQMHTHAMCSCKRTCGCRLIRSCLQLLTLISFFAAGYALFKMFKAHSCKTPIEILNCRYAKGEISREEYEKMKTDIISEESQTKETNNK